MKILHWLFGKKQPKKIAEVKESVPIDYDSVCHLLDHASPASLQAYWFQFYNINQNNPDDPMNIERKRVMEYIDKKLCEYLGKPYPVQKNPLYE